MLTLSLPTAMAEWKKVLSYWSRRAATELVFSMQGFWKLSSEHSKCIKNSDRRFVSPFDHRVRLAKSDQPTVWFIQVPVGYATMYCKFDLILLNSRGLARVVSETALFHRSSVCVLIRL